MRQKAIVITRDTVRDHYSNLPAPSCGCNKCKASSGGNAGAIGCGVGGMIGTLVCPGVGMIIGAVLGALAGNAFKDR